MFKITLLKKLLYLILIIIICSIKINCKKIESVQNEQSINNIELFFTKNVSTDPIMSRVLNEVKSRNKKFVENIIKKYGFAYWNKGIIFNSGKTYVSRSTYATNDTIVVIPLVQNNDTTVHFYLEATINDSVNLEFHNKSEYRSVDFSNSNTLLNDAEKVSLLYMQLSYNVFNSTLFQINDKKLFHNSSNYNDTNKITRYVKIEPTLNSSRNNLLGTSICNGVTVINIGTDNHCTNTGSCSSGTCDGCDMCVTWYSYTTTEISCFTDYLNVQTGGGITGGGGGGGWQPVSYSANCLTLTTLLQLNITEKNWLNNHPTDAQIILDFLEESRNINIDEDPMPVGYTPFDAMQAAKATIVASSLSSIYAYTEIEYNLLKQYAPTITIGTNAQKAEIFWSIFTFHAASSADINPLFTPTQHYLYSFYHLHSSKLNNTANGTSIANLNTNYLQTISGQGLYGFFINQSVITPTTNLTAIEFKRKTISNPNGKKIDIVWFKDNVTNRITFGNRNQLRDILGIPKGDPRIAHHIIPVNICVDNQPGSEAIQTLGGKGFFHMNQPENGVFILVPGSHPAYDARVKARLITIWA